jgi:hypothetical protein
MNADKPWRLADMKFQDDGGKSRAVSGPVVVEKISGKYTVRLGGDRVKLDWHDIEEKSVDPALSAAFNAWRG